MQRVIRGFLSNGSAVRVAVLQRISLVNPALQPAVLSRFQSVTAANMEQHGSGNTATSDILKSKDSVQDNNNQDAVEDDQEKFKIKGRLGRRNSVKIEKLLGVGEEERTSEVVMLFHASGLTCNQWRKLKSLWHPGKTLFQPSCSETTGGKKKPFFAQAAHSSGPTCMLYLPEEASERLEFLRSLDSMGQDMLLLYGQYRSNLVDHVDVEKASDFDELDSSLFNFYLPSSYLSFVCSGDEFFGSKQEGKEE